MRWIRARASAVYDDIHGIAALNRVATLKGITALNGISALERVTVLNSITTLGRIATLDWIATRARVVLLNRISLTALRGIAYLARCRLVEVVVREDQVLGVGIGRSGSTHRPGAALLGSLIA